MEGVQQVDQTLDYVNGATTYVTDAAAWAESIPVQAEQAMLVPEARDELILKLEQIMTEIQNFNNLDAPAVAQQVHDQIVAYNANLQQEISVYVENLKQNVVDPLALQDTQIVELFQQIGQTVGSLQELGQ
jgi:hypothetical protein